MDENEEEYVEKEGWNRPMHKRSLANLQKKKRGYGPSELVVPLEPEGGIHMERVLHNRRVLKFFELLRRDLARPRWFLMEKVDIKNPRKFYATIRWMMAYGWVEREKDKNAYYYRLTEKGKELKEKVL